jgi:hypothetical protein
VFGFEKKPFSAQTYDSLHLSGCWGQIFTAAGFFLPEQRALSPNSEHKVRKSAQKVMLIGLALARTFHAEAAACNFYSVRAPVAPEWNSTRYTAGGEQLDLFPPNPLKPVAHSAC